jgi:riboflavin kinase/FMN adenylyltransferase
MKVFRDRNQITDEFKGSVATIGNFDGVHLGHRHIFAKIVAEAARKGCKAVVITFEPHPKMILHPEIRPFYLITSLEEKIERIAETGVDALILIPFTREFSKTTAKDFICSILWEKLRIRKLFIGHDYTFGKGKEGNEAYLAAFGERLGFEVEVIGAFRTGDEIISSTLTRNTILKGDVRKAATSLGRPYSLSGLVIEGHRRGRNLGFPTANVKPDKDLLPARGIYAVRVKWVGKLFGGVLNIGFNPTFSDAALSVEVYLFDFNDDIYGERLEILFIDRIRDEVKFDGPEKLVEQIRRDVETAGIILGGNG